MGQQTEVAAGTQAVGVQDMTVADVLRDKGNDVLSIGPHASIRQAIDLFAQNSVGALLVMNDRDEILGILSERDIMRSMARDFDGTGKLTVGDLMVTKVIVGLRDHTLDYVMSLMTAQRIRHLPVVDQGKLAGIISIGDVIKTQARQATLDVHYLTDFIHGQYPA